MVRPKRTPPLAAVRTRRPLMGFYQERILPHLVHLAMRDRMLVPYRQRTIAAAAGRVLEIGVGCHLNRPIRALIEKAGFATQEVTTGYAHGLKPFSFMYEGRARPR